MSSRGDLISALPDDVLQHVLGLLPADEAVRTSVLTRRWRHQWRFMRRLRITSFKVWQMSANDINKFISRLLLLRDPGSTLEEVDLDYDASDHDVTYVNIWIRHALLCHAQVLSIRLFAEVSLVLDGPPLVSEHLRTLELTFLELKDDILDFSSCPTLEDLMISECILSTSRILSQSVKRLRIYDSGFCHDMQTRISVPSLVTLELVSFTGRRAPLLESMTLLETAFVSPCFSNDDYCTEGDSSECCGTCANCCGNDDHNVGCMLLGGLSSATKLKLITSSPGMIIFRRDLRWCPTFAKLKTLLLDDWCVEADLRALVCMLEHSPVLENLTLQLRKGPKRTLEREENYGLMEKSASISKHLKIVKLQCKEVDERVIKILKFLSTFDIEITIEWNGEMIPFQEVVSNFRLLMDLPSGDHSGMQG